MKTRKVVKVSLIVLFFLISLYASFVAGFNIPRQPTTGTSNLVAVTPTMQDPSIKAVANQIGADISQINLKYTQFTNANERAYFSYVTKGKDVTYTIEVRPGMDPNQTRKSFAHEYYHYVWKSHPESNTVKGALSGMYAADPVMKQRMTPYIDSGLSPYTDEFTNELFAIYCTEVYTPTLEPSVAQECTKWENLGSITTDRSLQ